MSTSRKSINQDLFKEFLPEKSIKTETKTEAVHVESAMSFSPQEEPVAKVEPVKTVTEPVKTKLNVETKRFTVDIPVEDHKAFSIVAITQGKDKAEIVRDLISKYVKRYQDKA